MSKLIPRCGQIILPTQPLVTKPTTSWIFRSLNKDLSVQSPGIFISTTPKSKCLTKSLVIRRAFPPGVPLPPEKTRSSAFGHLPLGILDLCSSVAAIPHPWFPSALIHAPLAKSIWFLFCWYHSPLWSDWRSHPPNNRWQNWSPRTTERQYWRWKSCRPFWEHGSSPRMFCRRKLVWIAALTLNKRNGSYTFPGCTGHSSMDDGKIG